jgi:flagellar hook-length control protein FliK
MPATNASARALASADIVSPEVMRGGAERAGADLAMAAAGSGARDMLRELNRQIDAGIDERVPATQANPHSEIRSAAATPLIFAEGTARGAAPNSTVIAPPLSSPDVHNAVSHQLGERLIAMASQGKHTARLQLHPAELGALEIRVSIQDDGAVVSITAQLPQARELIEAGLPRLRELFDASGTNLLDVDVSGSDGGGTQQFERSAAEFGSVSPQVAGVNEPPRFDPVGARSERLLDLLV